MIWTNIQDIPYQFISDAATSVNKKHKVESIRIDPEGGLFIKCSGKLSDSQVKDILEIITPGGLPQDYTVKYNIDYTQAETGLGWKTYVYTLDGIDYTKL